MINVWCVCVGDKYDYSRVEALRHMVKKHLPLDHSFNVLTESGKPGWWAKLDLFYKPGPSIYFDLDTVIVNDLTLLADYAFKSSIAATKNWSASGNGGYQSSVLCWNAQKVEIPNSFDGSRLGLPTGPAHCRNFGWYTDTDGTRHWGDQEFLSHNYGRDITEIEPGLIVSYKYHARNGLPKNARVVCFHGKPDYWECRDPWIKEALS